MCPEGCCCFVQRLFLLRQGSRQGNIPDPSVQLGRHVCMAHHLPTAIEKVLKSTRRTSEHVQGQRAPVPLLSLLVNLGNPWLDQVGAKHIV
eukprot:2920250-Rhodomonas_salina.3